MQATRRPRAKLFRRRQRERRRRGRRGNCSGDREEYPAAENVDGSSPSPQHRGDVSPFRLAGLGYPSPAVRHIQSSVPGAQYVVCRGTSMPRPSSRRAALGGRLPACPTPIADHIETRPKRLDCVFSIASTSSGFTPLPKRRYSDSYSLDATPTPTAIRSTPTPTPVRLPTPTPSPSLHRPTPTPLRSYFRPEFFVRQRTLDCLNRAPDAKVLDFWTRHITECGRTRVASRFVHQLLAPFPFGRFHHTGYSSRLTMRVWGSTASRGVPARRSGGRTGHHRQRRRRAEPTHLTSRSLPTLRQASEFSRLSRKHDRYEFLDALYAAPASLPMLA